MAKFLKRSFLFVPSFAALLIFGLHFFYLVDFHELDALDLRFRLRGQKPAHPKIVLVTIDDASLKAIGQWPWPRGNYAVLLDVLSKFNPRVIFFDILFAEAGPQADEDIKFRDAMQKSGRIILPFFYHSEIPFKGVFPYEPLREAAAGLAYVNILPDRDGRIRRMKAFLDTGEHLFYHPAVMAMLMQFQDRQKADEWLSRLPLDPAKSLLINFPGSMNSFRKISFQELIGSVGTEKEDLLNDLLSDAIIFVGHTATGTTDLVSTPYSTQMPGLAVQASALHTFLTGRLLYRLPEPINFLIMLCLAFFAAAVAAFLPPFAGLLAFAVVIVIYGLWNFLAFLIAGGVLPLFVPLAAAVTAYAMTLFQKYTRALFEREMLDRELQMASRIQEHFLPQTKPDSSEIDLAYVCRFTKQVGGDLYDWVDLGNNRFGFCVGDVSGKGMPAAIYMAKSMSDFRSVPKQTATAQEVCGAFNQILLAGHMGGTFLTLAYVVVDLPAQKLQMASAGHEPMIFFKNKTRTATVIKSGQGVPLGVFEEAVYDAVEINFERGDVFLLYSDGVKELRNTRGEEFGIENLRKVLEEEAASGEDANAIVQGLLRKMALHQRDVHAHDDRTLLCVRFI
ncbi:MAG: CHASE2 domain-containing protein [Candidatus Omnitrophica bacterium]|nr:CHASE2 domain-containing protein [Candidatus Omnitrophota bacterium]